MHLPPLIYDLAIILIVAGLMSLIFQRIRQPVVLGYLLAGVIIGPHTPPVQLVTDLPSIRTWGELGVIFLMFSLGLEFSFRKLTRVGVASMTTVSIEIPCLFIGGFALGRLFGWQFTDSIFLAAMLSISSTTIIIKALDELKLKTHRFAELIFGVLIVEDLIAILLLVGLSLFTVGGGLSTLSMLSSIGKLGLVVGGWMLVGYFVIPRVMKRAERFGNDEMITLLSLGMCLGLVAFAAHFNYSPALGAFVMGSILAESTASHQIERLIQPLRNLFGAVFFVSIGILIDPFFIWEHRGKVLIITAFVITVKIVGVTLGAILSGQTFRNSLRMGFTLAQIGEFSFIIAGLGMSTKATSDFLYPVGVAVSLLTTFTTPYLIKASGPISEAVEKRLPHRLQAALLRYARWNEARRLRTDGFKPYAGPAMRWILNSVMTSVFFVVGGEVLKPWLQRDIQMSSLGAAFTAWVLAAALSAPFIWGMFSAFKRRRATDTGKEMLAPLIVSRLFTLLLVGLLSVEYFPGRYVALFVTVVLLGLLFVTYRRLEVYYRWYEKRFLSTFERTEPRDSTNELHHLAPWDAHLVSVRVHANSPWVARRLSDAQLRSRFGVNIVAIRRGERTIVAPSPHESLLPADELIVLGTDEQVDAVRGNLEDPPAANPQTASSDYELRQLMVPGSAFFSDKTIRDSGLRERFRCMVVGIERTDGRIINPDSSLVITPGDVLWMVGERSQLEKLFTELEPVS